jgi:hypothetical protein
MQPVSERLFGMHLLGALRDPARNAWPVVPVGIWSASMRETHWLALEPSKGVWRFEHLDRLVETAERNGAQVMLSLGMTPTWASARPESKGTYVLGQFTAPARLADWEDYVRQVMTRYRGRIGYYEIWSEPKLTELDKEKGYFSAAQLVDMARVVHRVAREVDPAARIVSPANTGPEERMGIRRLEAFLAAGGAKYVDIIAHHFYIAPPENLPAYVADVRSVMARHGVGHLPVWSTEFGYLIADPGHKNTHPTWGSPKTSAFARVLSEDDAASYLARSYLLAAGQGLDSLFWFGWDIRNMSLTHMDSKAPNKAGFAYRQVSRWLLGATVESCAAGQVWVCRLRRDGRLATVVWNPDGDIRWIPDFTALEYETLDGRLVRGPDSGLEGITAGPSPLLLKSDRQIWMRTR